MLNETVYGMGELIRLRGLIKWGIIFLTPLMLFAVTRDSLHLSPAEQAAAPYRYDLVGWHAANFLDKWYHQLARALPWNSISEESKRRKVDEYFRLAETLSKIDSGSGLAVNEEAGARDSGTSITPGADEIRRSLGRLRNDVEETIEATISSVVAKEGLGFWGFLFPPVDIRLTDPPKLLVTSPRDRILRKHDVLLDSDLEIADRAQVEADLLSALVVDIGGVATYPASIPSGRDLERTLEIAAHEWLHHYFFFKPLGQNMFDSRDMQVLNETAADVIGREIGRRALAKLGGARRPTGDEGAGSDEVAGGREDGFDFDAEMSLTRLRVDELLAEGEVERAEAYMEERREVFQEHGFNIRKLNQAYFAFHGTYAESPTSVSPIGDQLHELHELVPDLGDLLGTVSGISTYREFLEKLRNVKARVGAPGSSD